MAARSPRVHSRLGKRFSQTSQAFCAQVQWNADVILSFSYDCYITKLRHMVVNAHLSCVPASALTRTSSEMFPFLAWTHRLCPIRVWEMLKKAPPTSIYHKLVELVKLKIYESVGKPISSPISFFFSDSSRSSIDCMPLYGYCMVSWISQAFQIL